MMTIFTLFDGSWLKRADVSKIQVQEINFKDGQEMRQIMQN